MVKPLVEKTMKRHASVVSLLVVALVLAFSSAAVAAEKPEKPAEAAKFSAPPADSITEGVVEAAGQKIARTGVQGCTGDV